MRESGAESSRLQPLTDDDPPQVGTYRLRARIGSGGMGRVYLSYTPGGRAVAVKVVRQELGEDEDFRRRFRQEVRAAARVDGLFTAPVLDSDTEAPRPWLVTAYVPGPSLSQAVARYGALPLESALLLVAGIAEALQSVHGAGIVHRDLKPSNVLLAADGPRVIDFGIARAAEATTLTASGHVVGTPSFMSPEQATGGRAVGPESDIFTLGQIAAFAVTGTPAFGEGSAQALLYRVVHETPVLSDVPEPLHGLVARCLAKDPAERPTLAQIMAACREAVDTTELRRPEHWLPAPLAAALPYAPDTGDGTASGDAPDTRGASGSAGTAAPESNDTGNGSDDGSGSGSGSDPGNGAGSDPGNGAGGPSSSPSPEEAAVPPSTGNPGNTGAGGKTGASGTTDADSPSSPSNADGTDATAPTVAPDGRARRRKTLLAVAVCTALALAAGAGYAFAPGGGSDDQDKSAKQQADASPGADGGPTPENGGTTADDDNGTEADTGPGPGPADKKPEGPAGTPDSGPSSDDSTRPSRKPPEKNPPEPDPTVQGTVRLPEGWHVNLDKAPLKPVRSGAANKNAIDFRYHSDRLRTRDGNRLALLAPHREGSLTMCRKQVAFVKNIDVDQVGPGRQICVFTREGHAGLVTLRKPAPADRATFTLAVWRSAATRP